MTKLEKKDNKLFFNTCKNKYWRQITFGGCGGMYNYCLGIAAVIQDYLSERDEKNRLIIPGTLFSGSSAGCFPALILALGLPVRELFNIWNIPLLDEVNKSYFKSLFRWNNIVRKHTMTNLPSDAYMRVSNNLNISLTRVRPWGNEMVSKFVSNKDLLDAIMASSHIPLIFGSGIMSKFRGEYYIDGSLTNSSPMYPNINPYASILVRYDRWRIIKKSWLWCSSNKEWARYQFKLGEMDALKNLTNFLAPLKNPVIYKYIKKNYQNKKIED